MRIETPPYSRVEIEPSIFITKVKHEPSHSLVPQSGFIKCPHCLNGIAKQSVDCKDLVWDCVMCGWSQPTRKPDMKHYGEDKVDYEKRY